jgi:hypothetical protein
MKEFKYKINVINPKIIQSNLALNIPPRPPIEKCDNDISPLRKLHPVSASAISTYRKEVQYPYNQSYLAATTRLNILSVKIIKSSLEKKNQCVKREQLDLTIE